MGEKRTFYDYYLEMIYQGTKRETMERLMKENDIATSYFVINKYWDNSESVIKMASKNADEIFNIDNGRIYIFKYTK